VGHAIWRLRIGLGEGGGGFLMSVYCTHDEGPCAVHGWLYTVHIVVIY
jgi:hypothetical protein